MAFQNLLEGDCGGQNPLMKLGGHFSQDQAFRQDRALPPAYADANAMVNDFLEERFSQNLQTFSMNSLAEELRDIDRFARPPLTQAPNVALLAPRETSSLWSEDFLRAEKHGSALNRQEEALQDFQPSALHGAVTDECLYDDQPHFERAVTNPKSVPELTDDWARKFQAEMGAEMARSSMIVKEAGIGFLGQPSLEAESRFHKFWQPSLTETAEKNDTGAILQGYGQDDLDGEQAWEQSQAESVWGGDDNKEFWESMQKMWQQLSSAGENAGDQWADEFGTFVDPYKTYHFEDENPMKELENPMEEGLRKLEAQDIPSAVLCFEAAVQAEPENALAWQYLGTTQAKNEQDPLAIAALKKCLNLEADNLTALLGLAISYTNESYQNSACEMLREWLARNPKYRSIPPPPTKQFVGTSLLDSDFHQEVKEYFIAAANRCPVGEIDGSVQGALGVLFNLSYEYDKAVDCFKAALQVNPNDYETWNRLGATLANGNRSEEAVDAYYNALHLSPGFIRARYNLGITCINLGATKEAGEHLLSALNQQAKSTSSRGERGSMSEGIWSTLRLVVSQMGDPSLLPAVEQRDLVTLNAAFKIK